MSTSISVTDVSSAGGAVMHDKAVRSEILCFIQNKPANVLTFDSVVDLCCNFYTADEVEQSRLLLTQFQTQHRLPKHKGNEADKKKRTVSDIVKACVDPSVLLPTFYAVDLARLPPVGVEHVDISALLLEVASLRAEVRAMVAIKEELANMHSAVAALNVEADAWLCLGLRELLALKLLWRTVLSRNLKSLRSLLHKLSKRLFEREQWLWSTRRRNPLLAMQTTESCVLLLLKRQYMCLYRDSTRRQQLMR